MPKISIANAKRHLSELISKSAFAHERFIITRRNKPVAALVSLEDYQIIEQHEEKQGLAAIARKWEGFEEVEEYFGDLQQLRRNWVSGRDVSL